MERRGPYRAGQSNAEFHLRYWPHAGVGPLVLALLVAVPLAWAARAEAPVPSVIVCTTARTTGSFPCSVRDAERGTSRSVACRDTPGAYDALVSRGNPLDRPSVSATVVEASVPQSVHAAPDSFIRDEPIMTVPRASGAHDGSISLSPIAAVETWYGIDSTRSLVVACAAGTPSGPNVRTVTVSVRERDHLWSALAFVGVLVMLALAMIRRRVTVALDPASNVLRIAETSVFGTRQRTVPTRDIADMVVSLGAGGILASRRVEIVRHDTTRVPLTSVYAPLTIRTHERTAERMRAALDLRARTS
jgi:hypothetical protein